MPSVNVQVSLSEALEVRGEALQEEEIWGVLCQAAEGLQDLFMKGDACSDGHPNFAITPDTFMLCGNGRIRFADSAFHSISSTNFLPPEVHGASPHTNSDENVEKMYVYGIGKTLLSSAEFNIGKSQPLKISSFLDSVLMSMCEENPSIRYALVDVLNACSQYNHRYDPSHPSSHYVISLYKLVLGSDTRLDSWFQGDEDYRIRGRRSPTSKTRPHSAKSNPNQTRSRSRSRSRGTDDTTHRIRQKDRPHPVGRDQPSVYQDGYASAYSPASRRSNRSYHSDVLPYRLRKSKYHDSKQSLPTSYDPYSLPRKHYRDRKALAEIHHGAEDNRAGYERKYDEPKLEKLKDSQLKRTLQDTYRKLNERRRKLGVLRHGIDIDELDSSDVMSLQSEATDYGDRRSLVSATSYTHGIYQPDLLSKYGSNVALRMGRSPISHYTDSSYLDDEEWLRQQQEETKARTTPSTSYIGVRVHGDGGRENSRGVPKNEKSKQRTMSPPTITPQKQQQVRAASPKKISPIRKVVSKPKPKRKFYGPEFVARQGDPVMSIVMPQTKTYFPTDLRHLTVILLTGQKLDVTCEPSNTGKQLYDLVVSHLSLPEHYFFGLTYVQDGEHYFIDQETKLYKIAPPNWKDGKKGRALPGTFTVHFRVKFYVENINNLRHATTRHLYYLQIRRDLLEERCHTTVDETMRLAALAMQAEYGDYEDKWNNKSYFTVTHYIPHRIIRKVGSAYARDNLPSMHKCHENLNDSEAEFKFICEAQLLPEHGVHYYTVFRSKKKYDAPVLVGIGVKGVTIVEKTAETREIVHTHPWRYTEKISFNRRRFSIVPKSESGAYRLAKLNYYTDSYRKGRYLLEFSTQQHRFQMKIIARTPNIDEMIDHEYPMEAGTKPPVSKEENISDDNMEYYRAVADAGADDSFEDFSDAEKMGIKYSNPNVHVNEEIDSGDEEIEAYNQQVLTIGSHSRTPSTTPGPERHVLCVDLKKEPKHGIGITIVGGENTGKLDLGIFVKSVLPGGPAERDGRIRAGDRIIAVNGQSLEGMPHHVAVELMRDSPSVVQLLLSQNKIPPPKSPLSRTSSPSVQGETVEEMILNSTLMKSKSSSPDDRGPYNRQRNLSPEDAYLPSSPDASDLELEDVVPPEALRPDYPLHMSPVNFSPPRKQSPTRSSGSPEGRQLSPHRFYENDDDDSDFSTDLELSHVLNDKRKGVYGGTFQSPTPLQDETSLSQHNTMRSQSVPASQPKPGDTYKLILAKEGGSLGLNVAGGVNTSVKHGGIYVKSLNPGGPAEKDGRVLIGDRVLSVNEHSLVGVNHRQAVETLRKAPKVVTLIMERGVPPQPRQESTGFTPSLGSESNTSPISVFTPSPFGEEEMEVDYPFVTKDNTFETSLTRGSHGLGFSIHTFEVSLPDSATSTVTRVVKVYPLGPAAQNGHIVNGDVVLEVNGKKLKGLTPNEALHVMKTSSPTVKLLVCRPQEGILSDLAHTPLIENANTKESDYKLKSETSSTRAQDVDTPSNSEDEAVESEQTPRNTNQDTADNVRKSPIGQDAKYTSQTRASETPTPVKNFMHDAGLSSPSLSPVGGESSNKVTSYVDKTASEMDNLRPDNLKSGEYEVTLTKGVNGFGFTVAGGKHSTGYFYIKDKPFDPAKSEEKLQRGDRLVKVNGHNLEEYDHEAIVNLLRTTKETIHLRMYHPQKGDESFDLDTDTDTEELEQINELKEGAGTKSSDADDDKPQKSVKDHIRSFETNRKIITPQDYSKRWKSLEDDVENEKESLETTYAPKREEKDQYPSQYQQKSSYVIKITLVKDDDDSLGFYLIQGEKGQSSFLYVDQIVKGGAADRDGRLQIGDKLLQVNGESVIGMQHDKAVTLFKQSPKRVDLAVSRDDPQEGQDLKSERNSRLVRNQTLSPISSPGYHTDSDLGSILDEQGDGYDTDTMVKDNLTKSSRHTIKEEEDKEEDNPDTFDAADAYDEYKKHHIGATARDKNGDTDSETDSWGDILSRTNSQEDHLDEDPSSGKTLSKLPPEINDQWLESLPVITVPKDSVHYQGRQLQMTLKQMKVKVDRDDPIEEYKGLKHAKLTDNCTVARKPENKVKNRYRNVLPYDATRVRLAGPQDYINANHIHFTIAKELYNYIACQGPLPNTTSDFWQMIWEQKCDVIAMLTLDEEGGKKKCHRYWPDSVNSPFTVFNRLEISLSQVQMLQHFNIHHIKVEDLETGQCHRVTHLNFSSWPDHACPDSALPLLRFIRFMHLVHESGPVVIHCSAGIGRTGALITVDVAMAMIEKDLKFDIHKIVNDIRRQRQGMIQTKDQYMFCYKACLQVLEKIEEGNQK